MLAGETKKYIAEHKHDHDNRKRLPKYFFFFSSGPITLFLLSWIGSSISNIVSRWFDAEKIKEQITQQQLETELSLLKSQINPHFLFNTLNSIYTLAVTNNPNTSDSVLKLSRIMRYTLEESRNDKVRLTEEVEFIQSYISLQQMRLNDNVKINFEINGNIEFITIPPLIFISFIENAFKYGISAHHETQITVTISVKDNRLAFECINNIHGTVGLTESTGTGIENVKRRLNLLYGDNFNLNIVNENNVFDVKLDFPIGA